MQLPDANRIPTVRYTTGIYKCANLNNADVKVPSVALAQYSLDSTYMLGLSLLSSAILLISVKYVQTHVKDGKTADTSPEFKRWWSIVRLTILSIVVFTVFGAVYMFFAIRADIFQPHALWYGKVQLHR